MHDEPIEKFYCLSWMFTYLKTSSIIVYRNPFFYYKTVYIIKNVWFFAFFTVEILLHCLFALHFGIISIFIVIQHVFNLNNNNKLKLHKKTWLPTPQPQHADRPTVPKHILHNPWILNHNPLINIQLGARIHNIRVESKPKTQLHHLES